MAAVNARPLRPPNKFGYILTQLTSPHYDDCSNSVGGCICEPAAIGAHHNSVTRIVSCTTTTAQHASSRVFTSSRDGMIRRWDISDHVPSIDYILAEHTHWVNDIAVIPHNTADVLLSCSSDRFIKVWAVPFDDLAASHNTGKLSSSHRVVHPSQSLGSTTGTTGTTGIMRSSSQHHSRNSSAAQRSAAADGCCGAKYEQSKDTSSTSRQCSSTSNGTEQNILSPVDRQNYHSVGNSQIQFYTTGNTAVHTQQQGTARKYRNDSSSMNGRVQQSQYMNQQLPLCSSSSSTATVTTDYSNDSTSSTTAATHVPVVNRNDCIGVQRSKSQLSVKRSSSSNKTSRSKIYNAKEHSDKSRRQSGSYSNTYLDNRQHKDFDFDSNDKNENSNYTEFPKMNRTTGTRSTRQLAAWAGLPKCYGSTYSFHFHSQPCTAVAYTHTLPSQAAVCGLDGVVCVFDLQLACPKLEFSTTGRVATTSASRGKFGLRSSCFKPETVLKNHSIWCADVCAYGNCLTFGDAAGNVHGWSLKDGTQLFELPSHSGVVRGIKVNADRYEIVSVSSDKTVRIWDLRVCGRARSTLRVHNDSIWAIDRSATQSDCYYTAGKDGMIFSHSSTTGRSVLLASTDQPITAIADGSDTDATSLWVANIKSEVRLMSVPVQHSRSTHRVSPVSQNNESRRRFVMHHDSIDDVNRDSVADINTKELLNNSGGGGADGTAGVRGGSSCHVTASPMPLQFPDTSTTSQYRCQRDQRQRHSSKAEDRMCCTDYSGMDTGMTLDAQQRRNSPPTTSATITTTATTSTTTSSAGGGGAVEYVSSGASPIAGVVDSCDAGGTSVEDAPLCGTSTQRPCKVDSTKMSTLLQLPGIPRLCEVRVLDTQLHVLTRNIDEEVTLWNLLKSEAVATFGKVNYDDAFLGLRSMCGVPQWCTCDVALGALRVTMDAESAFNAHILPSELTAPCSLRIVSSPHTAAKKPIVDHRRDTSTGIATHAAVVSTEPHEQEPESDVLLTTAARGSRHCLLVVDAPKPPLLASSIGAVPSTAPLDTPTGAAADDAVNIGEIVLRELFRHIVPRVRSNNSQHRSQRHPPSKSSRSSVGTMAVQPEGVLADLRPELSLLTTVFSMDSAWDTMQSVIMNPRLVAAQPALPFFSLLGDSKFRGFTSSSGGHMPQFIAMYLEGGSINELLPGIPSVEFSLLPATHSPLPSMGDTAKRLTARRSTKILKVMQYILSKVPYDFDHPPDNTGTRSGRSTSTTGGGASLGTAGTIVGILRRGKTSSPWDSTSQKRSTSIGKSDVWNDPVTPPRLPSKSCAAELYITVLCGGLRLHAQWTLGAVRDHVWKSSGTPVALRYEASAATKSHSSNSTSRSFSQRSRPSPTQRPSSKNQSNVGCLKL